MWGLEDERTGGVQTTEPCYTISHTCSLPRLGIVVTSDHTSVRVAGLNHMEAYAHRHGYGFHSSIIE